ncbi:hypothetical protein VNO78_30500 [Psophocarpus tetragonolobus]|uniref:Uncharacterized protein n=1 Tax=Psophocarpus tetragonolobus TaxID=3891 RepID=A0AAN9RWW1_PSOTE
MKNCILRLKCLLIGSSIVGFRSGRTSTIQVIIQCYWFLFTSGGCQVPQLYLVVIYGILLYTLVLIYSPLGVWLIGAGLINFVVADFNWSEAV